MRASILGAGLTLAAILTLPAEAIAQSLRLVPNQTSAGVTVDTWLRDNPGSSSGSTALTEWFVVPLAGSFLDPRILAYSFELRPRFSQQYATELPASLRTRDVGVAASASLFSTLPVSFDVTYNRSTGSLSGGFGARGEFGTSALFSVLSFDNVYLPMNVSYSERSRRNMTEVGANLTPVETSDALRSVRFTARNSKLTANLVWTDQEDRIGDNDFSLRDIDLAHRLRWGKGSTLQSRVEWSRRTGEAPYDRHSWDERLNIRHTKTTTTTWSYDRYRTEAPQTDLRGQGFSGRIDSRATSWLTLGLSGSRRSSETATGSQVFTAAGPRIAVRRRLTDDLQVSGDASAIWVRRSIDGTFNGRLQVLNEEHVIGATFLVELDQSFIDDASVVVRSEDQTIVYREGVDYVVASVGESTEIRVLPGSRIDEGDRILVSYFYQPDVEVEERGLRRQWGVGVTLGGLGVRHSRSDRSTETTGDGAVPLMGDFEEVSTVASFRGLTPLGRVRATAVHRSRESATIDYTTREANLVLGIPIDRAVQLFLDAAAREVEDDRDRIRVLSLGASSSMAFGSFLIDAGLRAQDWEQVAGTDEFDLTGRLGLRWRVRRTEVRLRANWDRRSMLHDTTTGLNVRLDVTRRF